MMNDKNLGCLGHGYRDAGHLAIIDLWDPDHPREVSYADYHAACDAVARGLLARGVQRGDRVGVFCSNRLEFLEVFYGAMRAGIIPVPIGIQLPRDTVEWMVRDCQLKLVFTEESLRDLLPSDVPQVSVDASEDGLAALKDPGPFTSVVPDHDDVAFQPSTSGSTGRPKGVLLSHRAHVWVANTISHDRDFSPNDRMIVAAPLYHKHAMNAVKSVLVGGSTVILMRKFDAQRYMDTVVRYRVSVLSGVPTIFAMLLQQRSVLDGQDFSYVRLITMGGAPASDVLIDAVADTFPSAEIIQIFGITETSAALFGPHPQRQVRPRHSVGWPVAGNHFRLLDPDSGEPSDFGVLHVQGPGMMNGYYNNPAEMAKRMHDGWFNTGDILRRDADGWYYFVGRSDDMFVTSGHNVYPGDVEQMLERHPDIEQAIVVPVPDEVRHRIPCAYIVKRTGSQLAEQDVKQFALDNAPPFQHPRRVFFLDTMPLNGVGKIDRKRLQAEAIEAVQARAPQGAQA